MAALPLKSIPLAPILQPISVTVTPIAPLSGNKLPDQTFNGRVDIGITVQSQTFVDPANPKKTTERRLIHVDLDNSEFSAAHPIQNQNDLRGYYIESVEYQIWLQKAGDPADSDKPLDHWSIMRESPDTSNQTGSVSSTISWGFNASAGAFGDMPTASIGGNIGVSETHSHTLTDFTFYQDSTARVLKHRIALTMCGDGSPYTDASSLVDQWQSPFIGIRLRPLPGLATSNVPIVGQAVWMNENDAGLYDKLTIHLAFICHRTLIEGENTGAKLPTKGSLSSRHYDYSQDIDFSLLA